MTGKLKPLPCPFCGAHPHKNLGKVRHDSLHGDRHQDTVIKCPHLCATMSGSASTVVDRWNTRARAPSDALAALEARDKRVRDEAAVEFSEMAASLVEDMSRKPNTSWGQVKGALRALGDIGDRDILVERDRRVREEALEKAAYAVDKASLRGAPALTEDQTHAVMDAILALIEGDQTDE